VCTCSIQLAIDVQLPKSCAGVAGKAIYIGGLLIWTAPGVMTLAELMQCSKLSFLQHSQSVLFADTEGSFMAERADDIAAAFLQHLQRMVKRSNSADKQASVSNSLLYASREWLNCSQPDTANSRHAMWQKATESGDYHCIMRWRIMWTAGAADHQRQPPKWHSAVPRAHCCRAACHCALATRHAGGRSAGELLPYDMCNIIWGSI
jgi:hypothetical protein